MQRLNETIHRVMALLRQHHLSLRIRWWAWRGARLERQDQKRKRQRDAQMTWMSNGTSTSKTGRTLG